MDALLQLAAEAVGESCAKTQDADAIGGVAGDLAAQVGRSGGITQVDATALAVTAAQRAQRMAGEAGLLPDAIESARSRAMTAASLGATMGQAFFDQRRPDVATETKKLVAAELHKKDLGTQAVQ
jgi:hypothetical protein